MNKTICFLLLLTSILLITGIVNAEDNLVTVVPAQKVLTGGTIEYKFLVTNNDQVQHKFQLTTSLSKDFKQDFFVDQQLTNSLKLSPKSQQIVRLKVKMPEQDVVNLLEFKIILKREDGKKISYNLAAIINKDYKIGIIHLPQALNILSGQESKFNIVLKNTGKNILKNVQLEFKLPGKWLIERKSPSQTDIKPGETATFIIKMYVPQSASSGYKNIEVTAFNNNASISGTIGPVQIQKNPNFLIWIVILLILAIIGTVFYFRKYGRR